MFSQRIADDVRGAPDASERAGWRIEIDDEAVGVEGIGGARRRNVELDRTLIREIRNVFGAAQDGIDGDVPVLAALAAVLLRGRTAPRHGEALDRLRIMGRNVLLEEARRGETLRVAADRERTAGDVRQQP